MALRFHRGPGLPLGTPLGAVVAKVNDWLLRLEGAVGGHARTLEQVHNVTDNRFGAKGGGVTDDAPAFTAALAATPAGAYVVAPPGRYLVRAAVPITQSVHLDFQGATVVCGVNGVNLFELAGTREVAGYILSAPAARGARSVTLTASPAGWAAGDLVLLRDDSVRVTDSSPNVNQEVHVVKSVAGAVVTFEDFVSIPKAVATENLYKLNPIEDVTVENVTLEGFEGATSGQTGFLFDIVRRVRFRNVKMTGSIGPGITVRRGYDVTIEDVQIDDPQATGSGEGYGVQLAFGTRGFLVRNVRGRGLRHLCDSNGAFGGVWEDATAHDCADVPFILSHNGWDADQDWLRCRAHDATSYGFAYSAQGATDPYDLRQYGYRLQKCFAHVRDSGAFIVGLYCQVPVEDCDFDVEVVAGAGNAVSSVTSMAARFRPAENLRSTCRVRARGFQHVLYQIDASIRTPTDEFGRVRFHDVQARYYNRLWTGTAVPALQIEGARIGTAGSNVLFFSYGATDPDLRYLTLRDIFVDGDSRGTFISWDEDGRHTSGILGQIENLHCSSTTSANLTVAAGATITLNNMLMRKDGKLVRLTAAGPVTLATPAFEPGLVEGQVLRLINVSANNITIPHGGIVENNSSASVVIGGTQRGAEWVWTGALWMQVT